MKWKVVFVILLSIFLVIVFNKFDVLDAVLNQRKVGTAIDSLNGVKVYYNGKISNIEGRNTTKDGYNLGLKYQCVEFVKRYYYEYYHHKMPDSYGNAKDFFDVEVSDGEINEKRGLLQCKQLSNYKPQVGDLVILDGHKGNEYGHVAIVSKVSKNQIEIIQQNPGIAGKSREIFQLKSINDKWRIEHDRVLGWLRLRKS